MPFILPKRLLDGRFKQFGCLESLAETCGGMQFEKRQMQGSIYKMETKEMIGD